MISCKNLEQVDIFQGLNKNEIEDITKLCQEVNYERDAIIFREGQKADFLYVVAKGKVDLRFRFPSFKRRFFFMKQDSSLEITMYTVPEEKTFGWSALIEPHQYTQSAYCVETCGLIRIDGKKLLELCERSSNLGFHVMRNLAQLISERLKLHRDQIKREFQEYFLPKW